MILAFTSLFTLLSSYLNNMAIFCLSQNCLFDNSNFARAHVAQLAERFHGKEEVACSIHAVGTNIYSFFESFNSLITLSEIDSSKSNQIGKHKCFDGICLLLPRA